MRHLLRPAWLLVALVACVFAIGASTASAQPPTVQLLATDFFNGPSGWFSGGDGALFRAFLIQGSDQNGPIYGQQNVCGQGFTPFPPLTLAPGTYDFTVLGTGTPLVPGGGSANVWFGPTPIAPITVTEATPNSPPTPFGNTIVTVSNFTMAESGIDRVSTCSVTPDGSEDTVVHFTVTVAALLPTSTDQCKDGGWEDFGVFKNQGDCVSFVSTVGKNLPTG
jgi:hypothetical protein